MRYSSHPSTSPAASSVRRDRSSRRLIGVRSIAPIDRDDVRVERFEWCDDFARARNFALDQTTSTGAAWALTIDTDERLIVEGYESIDEFRCKLEADLAVLTWMALARDGSYGKERLVRLSGRSF